MTNKQKLKKIIKINNALLKKFGEPKRNNTTPQPLDLLIATILSQNTNDKNSFKAFNNLKKIFPNFSKIKSAPLSKIKDAIKVAGLANQKANAIKNLISELPEHKNLPTLNFIKKWDNEQTISFLTKFKGVGLKTASCVLLFSLKRNVCPVDTHVHRTLNRLGVVQTNTPDKTYLAINENFPEGIAHSFHTNLIRLGREICLPSKPRCNICPLLSVCEFKNKNLVGSASVKQKDFMLLDNV